MTDFRFSTQDVQKLSLGLPREALESLAWADIKDLTGFERVRLLTSLDQRGVQIWVRANPQVLAAFNKRQKRPADAPLEFWLDEERSLIDGEWRQMKASRAVSLYAASKDDPALGAATMMMGQADDGHGGKMALPVAVPATEGLLEFALPVERAKVLVAA